MKKLIILSILLIISSLCLAQSVLPENREPGKCYAKCLTPSEIKTKMKLVPIYTGNNLTSQYVQKVNLCYLINPTNPSSKQCDDFHIVTNTILETAFQDKEMLLAEETPFGESRKTDWREIVCDTKMSSAFFQRVHRALQQKGFAPGEYVNQNVLKDNLANFQKFHNLAVGDFTVEAMQKLGVVY
jgi:hypothetical protein